jgi:hypothetical protein
MKRYTSTLKIETTLYSETFVTIYQTTRRPIFNVMFVFVTSDCTLFVWRGWKLFQSWRRLHVPAKVQHVARDAV